MKIFNDQARQYENIQDKRYEDKLLAEDKADYEAWLGEQEELSRQKRSKEG